MPSDGLDLDKTSFLPGNLSRAEEGVRCLGGYAGCLGDACLAGGGDTALTYGVHPSPPHVLPARTVEPQDRGCLACPVPSATPGMASARNH